jgi:hypothetical protein
MTFNKPQNKIENYLRISRGGLSMEIFDEEVLTLIVP